MTPPPLTAQTFFGQMAEAGALARLSKQEGLVGRYRFDIEGATGGTWVLDFDAGTVTVGQGAARGLVRAAEGDFLALVEGRMSAADGLLTERLHVTGEVAGLLKLAEGLRALGEGAP